MTLVPDEGGGWNSAAHDEAMRIASRAELLAKEGGHLQAIGLYDRAAMLEHQALDSTPDTLPRTRKILRQSLDALLYKAQACRWAAEDGSGSDPPPTSEV